MTRTRAGAVAVTVIAVLSSCSHATGPAPAPTSARPTMSGGSGTTSTSGTDTAPSGEVMLVAAGDIARCQSSGDEATADLLDRMPGTVAVLGDAVYPKGSAADFARCYEPSWGRHKHRTRPAVGNHEYRTAGAIGYFGYFGSSAGDPSRGYYSYDLGGWHVVVLNSNCWATAGCGTGSPQERWLRADLAGSTHRCTLAYWHHPLFTSGNNHGPSVELRPLFQALYDDGAEIVLAGHNHNYERFAPQNPSGAVDHARGIRAFVVGTGGASHDGFGEPAPHSEVRNADAYGVLTLTLRATGHDWHFVPGAGSTFSDRGSGTCH